MLYDPKKFLADTNLTDEEKEKLIQEVREEFPEDEMLFELHLFRASRHLKEKNQEE